MVCGMNLSRSATTMDQLRKVSQRTQHITVCCCCCFFVQCIILITRFTKCRMFLNKFNWEKKLKRCDDYANCLAKVLLILELLGNVRAKNRNLSKKKIIGDALSFSD